MGDILKKPKKVMLGLVLASMSLVSHSAAGETYILPIDFPGEILKIFIDGGSAKMLKRNARGYTYQLDMDDGVCLTDLTIIGVPAEPLRLRYDLCAGKLLSSNFGGVYTESDNPKKR